MCFGGGGGGQMPQDNSLQVEMMQQQAAQQEQQRQDALQAQQRTTFQDSYNRAFDEGVGTGRNTLQQMGIDPGNDVNDPMHQLALSITRNIRNSVPDLDSNPASYYTPEAYTAGINKQQDLNRQGYTRQVNNTFKPGFEDALLPDSSIDSIIDSILGQQRTTAKTSLDYNQQRGLLNDTGYNAALGEFGNQESAARSTLRGVGDSVLGTQRGELSAIRGQAGDAASSYMLGSDAPDIGGFYNRATAEAGRDLTGLEGGIRSALGGTQLFDIANILNKGGIGQGPINLTTAGDSNVPFSDKKKQSSGRGLGSTGVF